MKKYDVIIPLGEFCATAVALRDAGIRQASYPFDWSAGIRWDKCGNCGFLGKIRLIINDFKDAFNLEDLEEFWSPQTKHRGVINKRTGLQYVHDFEWSESIAGQYPTYLEKYQRRVKRLYTDIDKSKKILFVFITRETHKLSMSEINEALKLLNNKFPHKDFDFLLIQNSTDCELSEIRSFEVDKHVFIYLYKDVFPSSEGNQKIMKRILSEFINGTSEYNFSTDNIKNYGLSVKENWGRWSDGNLVFLEIPVFSRKNLIIDFSIMAYVVKEHPKQEVEIFLKDKKLADWSFKFGEKSSQTTLKISAEQITELPLTLQFKIKNPVSLKELNLGKDTRKIGIGFKTMKIQEE